MFLSPVVDTASDRTRPEGAYGQVLLVGSPNAGAREHLRRYRHRLHHPGRGIGGYLAITFERTTNFSAYQRAALPGSLRHRSCLACNHGHFRPPPASPSRQFPARCQAVELRLAPNCRCCDANTPRRTGVTGSPGNEQNRHCIVHMRALSFFDLPVRPINPGEEDFQVLPLHSRTTPET